MRSRLADYEEQLRVQRDTETRLNNLTQEHDQVCRKSRDLEQKMSQLIE